MKLIIHGGSFHADDVMVAVLCKKFFNIKNENIFRKLEITEDEMRNSNIIIADIGNEYDGKRLFDHHQKSAPTKPDGTKYCSAGQILLHLKKNMIINRTIYNSLYDFIDGIDRSDNYGDKNSFSNIIASFNPQWNSDKNQDESFFEAVNFAEIAFEKLYEKALAIDKANKVMINMIENLDEDEEILVMEKLVPWLKHTIPTNIKFVIYPSNRGGWNAQAVPISMKEKNTPKISFPQEIKAEKGVFFVHEAGFLISAETKEEAFNACSKILNNNF